VILNISEAANLAIHAMTYLASHADEAPVPAGRVARSLEASEAHLSKVLQRLAKTGLVKSLRGPRGGFSLARPPESVNLLEIYEAVDGSLATSDCLFGHRSCDRPGCVFGNLLADVRERVDGHFSTTSLADLVG